jgi:NitT/TauT family transport system substrate-binding protein
MKTLQRFTAAFVCSGLMLLLFQANATATLTQPRSAKQAVQRKESAATQEIAQSQETVRLKVVTQPFMTFVPFYIAQEEGYFTEQRLEVELVRITVNQEILPALSSGQVDVASGLLSAGLFNAIARGGNFKIVADKGYIDPNQCDSRALVARRDLVDAGVFQSARDLRGHTVNVVPATWYEYYLARLLETGGLTVGDIKTIEVPVPAIQKAFEQKRLDLAMNSEPWLTRFKLSGHRPVLKTPSELLPRTETAAILYGSTLLGDDLDVARRFMIAYLKAVRRYNEGKTPRNIGLVARFTKLDPELLQMMCWPSLRRSGELNVQSVLDFQQWAIEAGYLEEIVPPEQFWDGRFVADANKALD